MPFPKTNREEERYLAARDAAEAMLKSQPTVAEASFKITHFVDAGRRANAPDLQAALEFVQSRFDLAFGLFDLARDPVLRQSLLDPSKPVEISGKPLATPDALDSAVREDLAERKDRAAAEKLARRQLYTVLGQALIDDWKPANWGLNLPLAKDRVLSYRLQIYKREARLELVGFCGDTVEEFVRKNLAAVTLAAGRPPEEGSLVRFPGFGWSDDIPDPRSLANVVTAVIESLRPLVPALVETLTQARTVYIEADRRARTNVVDLWEVLADDPELLSLLGDRPIDAEADDDDTGAGEGVQPSVT